MYTVQSNESYEILHNYFTEHSGPSTSTSIHLSFHEMLDTLTWKHLGAIFYKQLSWDTYITYIRSPAPMSAER